MNRIFLVSIVILIFSAFANAQAQMNYHYLEVTDSDKKPIPAAKVEVRIQRDNKETLQTDSNGKANIGIWYPSGLEPYASVFTITKPGYYPFYDFGLVWERFNYRNIKLELLKIPTNKQERKVLGKEQLKREFITAVRRGDIEAVRKLLQSGISPNLTTGDLKGITTDGVVEKTSAISFAIFLGHGAVVKLLLEKGASLPKSAPNPSRPKPDNSNVLLYYLGADYNTRTYVISDENERRKLLQKIDEERNEGLKALIKAGADVNVSASDVSKFRGSPALIASLDKSYVSAAKILIENGAEINSRDSLGNTALMSAVNKGLVEAVKLLIEKGADVNAKTQGGGTALAIAEYKANYSDSYKEIVKILKDAGAKE